MASPPRLHSAPLRTASATVDRPSGLARRIEALSRALENPDRIVNRLVRFIATLPRGLLQPSTDSVCGVWRHDAPEFADCGFHSTRALRALEHVEPA